MKGAKSDRLLAIFVLVCLPGLSGIDASARSDAGSQSNQSVNSEISVAALPPEARRTLQLIKQGGPFPYERDNVAFGNYEKRLPQRERGYYREYTVKTPGIKGRGARRIVAGCALAAGWPCGTDGELYYTDDHYQSFRRIRE